jgi:hypothetical protein
VLTFLRNVSFRDLVASEGPGLLASLAIAEFFYKFHASRSSRWRSSRLGS